MPDYRIVEDDLTSQAIADLLRLHLDDMHSLYPSESVHALPIERLRQPDVTFFSAWDGSELAACGALKRLDTVHGEIKSMRAAPNYRGKGAGKAILGHLIEVARQRGYTRLSLETGAIEAQLPARRLYEAHEFVTCPPFADYGEDPLSICMTRSL